MKVLPRTCGCWLACADCVASVWLAMEAAVVTVAAGCCWWTLMVFVVAKGLESYVTEEPAGAGWPLVELVCMLLPVLGLLTIANLVLAEVGLLGCCLEFCCCCCCRPPRPNCCCGMAPAVLEVVVVDVVDIGVGCEAGLNIRGGSAVLTMVGSLAPWMIIGAWGCCWGTWNWFTDGFRCSCSWSWLLNWPAKPFKEAAWIWLMLNKSFGVTRGSLVVCLIAVSKPRRVGIWVVVDERFDWL